MGELADQVIEGSACELCLIPFVNKKDDREGTFEGYTHGYPAVCSNCWKNLTPEEKKYHQKATKPTL